MTKSFHDQRRLDGRWFYCPNGHQQGYTDARKRRKSEEADGNDPRVREANDARLRAIHEQEQAEARAADAKAIADAAGRSTVKRIVGAVMAEQADNPPPPGKTVRKCPHCGREFIHGGFFIRHMRKKHPEKCPEVGKAA
jgi:hypothetical protein